jgi:energy-converting hydrogenase Eha subunit B
MIEEDRVSPLAQALPDAPQGTRSGRRLPAVVRYLVAAAFGGMVAALASYLMRSIGF